eukprot:TRINITY_DN114_c6_g1_i2.p1 TRINITY_DN114_c6_g1~~TRINITY_DN114_c6_g1_i2.p1  ORF type:complete len:258 (+),score=28.72 TRINITY_DN114_c6_g1_i2:42-815(+)
MGLLKVFDPMGVFCALCLLVPLFYDADTTNADRIEMITCPYVFGPVLLTIAVYVISHVCGKRVTLSDKDSVKAGWYLFNGTIIMMLMDGFAGGLQAVPLLSPQYLKVDARYVCLFFLPLTPCTTRKHRHLFFKKNRYADKDSSAVMIAYIEIFMQTPACLITYLCYCWNHPLKYPMEIVTCTLHFMGTVAFAGPVILSDFEHVYVDRNFEFTPDHLVFFWFAFGINTMWIIVPFLLGKHAVKECAGYVRREMTSKRN